MIVLIFVDPEHANQLMNGCEGLESEMSDNNFVTCIEGDCPGFLCSCIQERIKLLEALCGELVKDIYEARRYWPYYDVPYRGDGFMNGVRFHQDGIVNILSRNYSKAKELLGEKK